MNKKSNDASNGMRAIDYMPIARFVNRIMPMNDADRDLLYPVLQIKQVDKNGFLLREGEIYRNVYFLTKGFETA